MTQRTPSTSSPYFYIRHAQQRAHDAGVSEYHDADKSSLATGCRAAGAFYIEENSFLFISLMMPSLYYDTFLSRRSH